MYQAKDAGRNGYHFYTPALTAAALQRVHLEADLRRGLGRASWWCTTSRRSSSAAAA